ncbi:hypothetical protein Sinac_5920 [Singulisphaera acidiphila DSM 18658]|uniref:Uncharacterized protein n=1 Tax=Singulisphaera acidiphila (strain ATCC BAA-1392 / DSM 18658 / VKM B-2454 / MOB10) TaxID=886293 RepID=L0DMI2_SINAD|nr:hypothetical protein Sinac_5920 [Singulisphaera acidiphila DSM 18658]
MSNCKRTLLPVPNTVAIPSRDKSLWQPRGAFRSLSSSWPDSQSVRFVRRTRDAAGVFPSATPPSVVTR